MTLSDRRNEFINNNKSLCDENCILSGYENGRIICSCKVKYIFPKVSEIKVNKNELYKFMNINQIMNFNVLKCTKLLFSLKGLKTNIGFYSFLPTIVAYFTSLFLLCSFELEKLKNEIDEVIKVKKLYKKSKEEEEKKRKLRGNINFFANFLNKKYLCLSEIKEEEIDNINNKEIETDDDKQIKNTKNNKIYKKSKETYKKKNTNNSSYNTKKYKNLNKSTDDNSSNKENKKSVIFFIEKKRKGKTETLISSPPKNTLKHYLNKEKKTKMLFEKKNSEKDNDISNKELIEANDILALNKIKKDVLTKKQRLILARILAYNDKELNDLSYKKAFKHDHRTFIQYYFSLFFTKHILFQIFNTKDYNACSIKVLLLFFNFSSCYAVNALFFNDETMHQIYEDEGDFNFIYQLPQIAYSTLISIFVDNLTTFLALSEDNIIELKRDKNLDNLTGKSRRIKMILKIKFIFFYIFNIILILLFWYYLGCFCAVYKNTQYHLIKDTLISFFLGFIAPFGTNLITAFLRKYSLKENNIGRKMIFNLSRLLQEYL